MEKVKPQNYLTIQGWMLNIGCKNIQEVVAFALVYGFSQDNNSQFSGSISYIQEWLMCSRPTAIATMKSLEEKGLIKKEQYEVNGVKFNRYTALGGGKEILLPVKEIDGGSKESLPNNNIINIDNPPLSKDNTPQGDESVMVEEISSDELVFDTFRRAYKGTKRGLNTEFTNFKKKNKDWREVLPLLLPLYEQQQTKRQKALTEGCFVPQEKNLQTYINQRCWEAEEHFAKDSRSSAPAKPSFMTEEGMARQHRTDELVEALFHS